MGHIRTRGATMQDIRCWEDHQGISRRPRVQVREMRPAIGYDLGIFSCGEAMQINEVEGVRVDPFLFLKVQS